MYNTLTLMFRHLTQSLRLMIGVPGYGTYVEHMKSALWG